METSKRQALGKGLRALIPVGEDKPQATAPGYILCSPDELLPNGKQPRQRFDPDKLRELVESIKSKGVIQPLIVRKHSKGYQIVAGERRFRAAKLAGVTAIPVVVKELSDAEILEVALVENLQREDLNPLEEAEAYRQLIEEHGLTQDDLATRVGRQRSTVTNTLRLLKLPEMVRRFLQNGELSMGHARAILGLSTEAAQLSLAKRVIKEKLSVRECEELARAKPDQKTISRRIPRQKRYSTEQLALIETLQRRFGTKVDLHTGQKGGKLIIHYFSLDELDHILAVIGGR
jgi:ParB family chromosome partitioning protein